jgi:DNA repair exonuclease SbcCD ATPase subunit
VKLTAYQPDPTPDALRGGIARMREQHETIKRLESIIEEHKDVGRYYLGVIGDLERQLANLRTRAKHHLEVSQDHGDCPCCGAHVTAGGKHQDCDMFTPDGEVK